ncbi:MAG: flippase activity-associated protein Agl23 [Haloferacaceae archaeon]
MRSEEGTDRSRTLFAVLAVTALALAVRLVGLGTRVFHWDEGRVGYWILRYHESGQFSYRPIVHGPFLFITNDYVFSVLPPSDFSARLVVALVGGLLPLSAWLLRDRLRGVEIVALAAVLAANPLLVYYSRFMRNDVLVGAFAFVALALFVRAVDAGKGWLVLPSAASLALAFTAKENALIYVVCFLGAGFLLLDHRLFRAARSGRSVRTVVRDDWRLALAYRLQRWGGSVGGGVARTAATALGSAVVFFAVVVFFYAPRPDLWTALANPAALPGVVEAATLGTWDEFWTLWVEGAHQSHDYLPFLYDYLETLAYGAPVVLAFAVVGVVADGYLDDYRELVAFAAYWGAVSALGYPIATDIRAPWAAVHAVVPLAVPAAVGLAFLYRQSRPILASEGSVGSRLRDVSSPRSRRAVVASVLLLSAAVGAAGANAVYMNSASDDTEQVLQWAQPENDLKETLGRVRVVAQANEDGPDVLFYGTTTPSGDSVRFYVENESSLRQPPPGGPAWHTRLPLPWYLERYGATVTSTPPREGNLSSDPPPVIVAYSWNRTDVAEQVSGYSAHAHDFRLWSDRVVVFVDESELAAARAE